MCVKLGNGNVVFIILVYFYSMLYKKLYAFSSPCPHKLLLCLSISSVRGVLIFIKSDVKFSLHEILLLVNIIQNSQADNTQYLSCILNTTVKQCSLIFSPNSKFIKRMFVSIKKFPERIFLGSRQSACLCALNTNVEIDFIGT